MKTNLLNACRTESIFWQLIALTEGRGEACGEHRPTASVVLTTQPGDLRQEINAWDAPRQEHNLDQ